MSIQPLKAYFRLIDPDLSAEWGRPAYLHQDQESPTDNPAEALKTPYPDMWTGTGQFIAELIPPDQYMKLHQQPGLFDEKSEEPKEEKAYVPGRAWNWNSAPGFDKNKNRKRR